MDQFNLYNRTNCLISPVYGDIEPYEIVEFMKNNKMPRVGKALAADSTAMMFGSIFGTSPVGAFVESSAGIAVGGRSGLTAVFVATGTS